MNLMEGDMMRICTCGEHPPSRLYVWTKGVIWPYHSSLDFRRWVVSRLDLQDLSGDGSFAIPLNIRHMQCPAEVLQCTNKSPVGLSTDAYTIRLIKCRYLPTRLEASMAFYVFLCQVCEHDQHFPHDVPGIRHYLL